MRKGILPEILAALMSARAATREALKGVVHPGARAVLDSRQKALKLTANALYGFTGRSTQRVPARNWSTVQCHKARAAASQFGS